MHRSALLVAAILALVDVALSRPGDISPPAGSVSEQQLRQIREAWGVTADADLPIPLIFPGEIAQCQDRLFSHVRLERIYYTTVLLCNFITRNSCKAFSGGLRYSTSLSHLKNNPWIELSL